jgi:hypothetical protein
MCAPSDGHVLSLLANPVALVQTGCAGATGRRPRSRNRRAIAALSAYDAPEEPAEPSGHRPVQATAGFGCTGLRRS